MGIGMFANDRSTIEGTGTLAGTGDHGPQDDAPPAEPTSFLKGSRTVFRVRISDRFATAQKGDEALERGGLKPLSSPPAP
jgi:hypothetical protein